MFSASISKPTGTADKMGMTMIGMTGRNIFGTGIFFSKLTTWPATRPMTSAPRNPALTVLPSTVCGMPAIKPPMNPGTSPGLPAMPKEMNPASTAGNNLNAVAPIVNMSCTNQGPATDPGRHVRSTDGSERRKPAKTRSECRRRR